MKSSWASILRTARASAFLVLITVLALLVPSQMEDMIAPLGWVPHAGFQFALWLFAFSAWHWSRAVLSARFGGYDGTKAATISAREMFDTEVTTRLVREGYDPESVRRTIKVVPRLLFLAATVAGLGAAFRSDAWADFVAILVWCGVTMWVLERRSQIQRRLLGKHDLTLAARRGKAQKELLDRSPPKCLPGWIRGLISTLDALTWYAPFGATVTAILLALPLTLLVLGMLETLGIDVGLWDGTPATLGRAFPGPAAVLVCLALAFGPFTVLTYWADRLRIGGTLFGIPWSFDRPPAMLAFFALVMLAPSIANLHAVRLIPDDQSPVKEDQREELAKMFTEWVGRCASPNGPVRPVIVALSGGASRAGLWGARVLRSVDSATAETGTAIFAISSVSGGSVGAAAYLSLRAGQDNVDGSLQHPCQLVPDANADTAIRNALARDAVAPLLAGAVFSDVPRAFLAPPLAAEAFLTSNVFHRYPLLVTPFPQLSWSLGQLPNGGHIALHGGDRAEALERAFERNWSAAFDGRSLSPTFGHPVSLSEPFLSLFYKNSKYRTGVPIWLANGTDGQNGGRVLTQPLRPFLNWLFLGARDVHRLLGSDIPISTAIDNTARFPFLSPSGELTGSARPEEGYSTQVIDGGYFENLGLVTALELAHWLKTAGREALHGREVLPIIVQATANGDSTEDKDIVRCYPQELKGADEAKDDPGLSAARPRGMQLLVPVLGLNNVRGGHSAVALRQVRDEFCSQPGGPAFFHFYLYASDLGDVPLNWVLSDGIANYIWTSAIACRGNTNEEARLKALLGKTAFQPSSSPSACLVP